MSNTQENIVQLPQSSATQTTAGRLEQIRAERAQLARERERREEEQDAQELLEMEERGLADDRAIAAAVVDHGPLGKKIAAIYTDQGVVIVKRPHHVMWKRFQDSGETTTDEFEKLVLPCVVHPDRFTFVRYCEAQAAILGRCANQVAALAGFRLKEVGAK